MSSKKTSSTLTLMTTRPGKSVVYDPLEIQRTLDRAAGNLSKVVFQMTPAQIQAQNQILKKEDLDEVVKYSSHLVDYSRSRKTFRISLPEHLDLRLFASLLRQKKKEPVMILIYLKGQTVAGILAEPVRLDSDGIEFALPSRMFKIQRRERERFEIPLGYEYMVEFSRPGSLGIHRRKLLNLSAEGLAFRVVTSREAEMFKPGQVLHGLRISLQGTEVSMDVEVRNHLPNTDRGGGFKIGVRIIRITPEASDFLAGFLLQQMSQFVS